MKHSGKPTNPSANHEKHRCLRNQDTNEELQIDENDHSCGWFSFRPNLLNYFTSSRWLLFCICCWSIVGGMAINGFTNVSITSIERRFELSSSKSALIPAIYEIPSATLSVIVGYFATHGSKPRWMACGIVFQAVGCLLFTLPHFLTNVYIPEVARETISTTTGLCGEQSNETTCGTHGEDEESISSLSSYLYIFLLSQFLLGIGASAGVLSDPFLDERVKGKNVGMYIGIFRTCYTLGPALGFVAGGIVLDRLYTDFPSVGANGFDIDPSSHQWVGAWWLGFLVCGCVLFLVAVPLSCFPSQLPGSHDILADRREQRHDVEGLHHTSDPNFGKGIADLPLATTLLFRNPIFLLLTVVVIAEAMFMVGAEVFLPKFLEEQFGLSAGNASLAVGVDATIFGCTALLLSGWLIKRFRLKIPAMLKMCLWSHIVCGICLFAIFLRCDNTLLAGVITPYAINSTSEYFPSLDVSCNNECQCSTAAYSPVCGSQGIVYFSPCHAGCKSYDNEEYGNCSCIKMTPETSLGYAVDGVCQGTCPMFYVFMVFLSIIIFTIMFCETPWILILLRCVPENLRSYTLGLEALFGRLLGSLPGPIIFGLLIDNACVLWHEECNEKGQCWFHDRDIVSRNLVLFALTMKIIVIVCYLAALRCYKPVGKEDARYTTVPIEEK